MYIIELLIVNGKVTREGLLNVAAFVLALLFALILHELSHGLTALAFGDKTAKQYGRLTLNPAKHFDLTGLLMMLFVGFGWAKPVPVNVNNFKNKSAGMICVSLAGVVTNIFLAFLFAGLYTWAGGFGNEVNYYLGYFCYILFYLAMMLNINFALFNILPLFPLDGYRLLSCFVPQENAAMKFLRRYSLYILLGLIFLNIVLPEISPIYWYIVKLGRFFSGAFCGFWGLL